MKHLIVFILLIPGFTSVAQITEQELEKAAQDMQRQADSIMRLAQMQVASASEDETISPEITALPPRQTALIASIRPGIMTKPQLITYLNSLDQWLIQKLPATHIRNARTMSSNSNGLTEKAVSSWYNNQVPEAIYLALLASKQKPADPLVLNNLSSLLTLGGAAHKAIPILRIILNYYPNNTMALNNTGQAWASLGQGDSAMRYLQACIGKTKFHPEANHTAGIIAKSRGNTSLTRSSISFSLL